MPSPDPRASVTFGNEPSLSIRGDKGDMMPTEETRELVNAVMRGRISRRDFVIKGLALGMSVSGINAALAAFTPAASGQAASNTYSLLVSSSPNRSSPAPLSGKTVSDKIYVFTSPETGVYKVRFYLDDPNLTGTPRRVETSAPYDFAGGTVSTANPFDTTTVSDGSHTITAAVVLTSGSTEVVNATFAISNNSGTARSPDQVHLAWVGAPSTTLSVVWRTWDTATPSRMQYRAAGSTTWLQATGAQRTSGTTGKLHEANLSGLTPSTTYEYQVQGDGGTWSEVYSARTAPPLGPADFDAIYFADTGLVGRVDGLATGTKQVVDEIVKLDPLFVLPGGDYAYYDTERRYATLDDAIDAWFNQMQAVATRCPMMPTYGNHEMSSSEGFQPWAARFPTPNGFQNRRNYSFDVGDAHFVSIHATSGLNGFTDTKLQWIEQDMQSARARGQRWIIPYYHVSPFADGTNHPSNLTLRSQLGPIFERQGVKVAISSHDQAYERSYPLTDVPATNTPTSTSQSCYSMEDGVTWVKVSSGGKLSNKNKSFSQFATNPPPTWTAYRNNTLHHFARLRVFASGSIRLDAYGVKGDGSPPVLVDTFEYKDGGC
jgi:hypothetical protein